MTLPTRIPDFEMPVDGPLVDPFGRVHTYMRVSVTDRCNYRCVYCMPPEGLEWLPRAELLTYEEIARIVRVVAGMGIRRIRLTGGEPTVRRDLPELVARIAATDGIDDLSMTTNGHLFARRAGDFAEAGLRRINVSLDTLDREQFARITRGGDLVRVLDAIDAARAAGIVPIKINAVMVAGENDAQLEALVEHFSPHADTTQVRFIEAMPFTGGVDKRTHISAASMRTRLARRWTLAPIERTVGGGPATTWRIEETGLVVGFISPITEHFCHSCNRLRLMADGHLRTCLSRDPAPSLRDVLRAGADDDALALAIRRQVWGKVPGHEAHLESDWRAFEGVMTRIGG